MEVLSLDQLKNTAIGQKGSEIRDAYEFNLNMKIISHIIKEIRKEQNLTQEELGVKIGVQKSQISRIENSLKNANLFTVKRIFEALNAKIKFEVIVNEKKVEFEI
ncbi:helix-turn-helix transcriptional regulator [Flavobacterium sp. DGU38]|jgi:HTH-type transcriptional regulator/antitoxin HipB|uniref:Helix-turn-helix n=2 Tax=Flavobacterium TaxID=237 RepID=A0A1M5Q4J3_FLAJO|nr:helix-turn-helix transcriptional regulator [Flavobacterium johnsoniae]SHH08836.1 Helix-turn-helix [Flavobacterium johnsoniae]